MSLPMTTAPAPTPHARWRALAAHGGAAALLLLLVLYLFFESISDLGFQSRECPWWPVTSTAPRETPRCEVRSG